MSVVLIYIPSRKGHSLAKIQLLFDRAIFFSPINKIIFLARAIFGFVLLEIHIVSDLVRAIFNFTKYNNYVILPNVIFWRKLLIFNGLFLKLFMIIDNSICIRPLLISIHLTVY